MPNIYSKEVARPVDPVKGGFAAIYAHPFFDRLQTRGRRRLIAVAYLTVLGLTVLLAAATGHYVAVLAMLAPFTAAAVLLDGCVRGVTELGRAQLDERQRALRGWGFARSYRTGALFGLVGGFAAASLMDGDKALLGGVVVLVLGLVMGLPALTLAWHLPDEDDAQS